MTWNNLTCGLEKKAERNNFLQGWTILSINNCKNTEQSAVRGDWHKNRIFVLRNSSHEVCAINDRRGEKKLRHRKRRTKCRWARKLFFFLSIHFYSKTSLRCSTYYGAQNCLMCLFLLLMQQPSRKTGYGSPRERVQYNKTCKHNLSN